MAETEMKYQGNVRFNLTKSVRITDAGRDSILAQLRRACEIGAISVEEYQDRLDFVMDSLTTERAEIALRDLPQQEIGADRIELETRALRQIKQARQARQHALGAVLKRAAMIPVGAIPFICVILTIGVDPASNAGQRADGFTAMVALWWIIICSLLTGFKWYEGRKS